MSLLNILKNAPIGKKLSFSNLFLVRELYELYNLMQMRVADPKTNPSVTTNVQALDTQIKQLFIQSTTQFFYIIVGSVAIALLVYALVDSEGLWTQIREALVALKEMLKPGPANNGLEPKSSTSNLIDYLDGVALKIFKVVSTLDNYSWLAEQTLSMFEFMLNKSIKASVWTIEHWPSILLLLIILPIGYYLNFLFVQDLIKLVSTFIYGTGKQIIDTIAGMAVKTMAAANQAAAFLHAKLGFVVTVICFPATAAVYTIRSIGAFGKLCFSTVWGSIKWAYSKIEKVLNAISAWFDGFRPGSAPGEAPQLRGEGGPDPDPDPGPGPGGGGGGPGSGPGSDPGSGSDPGGALAVISGQRSDIGFAGPGSNPSAGGGTPESSNVSSLIGADRGEAGQKEVTSELADIIEGVDLLPLEEMDPVLGSAAKVIIIAVCMVLVPQIHNF